nr:hypothetical protein CFP56_55285 [Quercus suber]
MFLSLIQVTSSDAINYLLSSSLQTAPKAQHVTAPSVLFVHTKVQRAGNPAAGPILLRLRLTDYTKKSSKILPVGDCQPPSLHC